MGNGAKGDSTTKIMSANDELSMLDPTQGERELIDV